MTTIQTFTLTVVAGTACSGVAFTKAADVNVGSEAQFVAIGDFNNDGNQDIAGTQRLLDAISIRLGNGAGGFSGTTQVSVGDFPVALAIGDFNNDGKQDLAVANDGSRTVSIRLGDGLGGFNGTTEVGVGSSPAGARGRAGQRILRS